MSSEPPPPAAITQTAKNVISEKQVLSHVLMIRHAVIRVYSTKSWRGGAAASKENYCIEWR